MKIDRKRNQFFMNLLLPATSNNLCTIERRVEDGKLAAREFISDDCLMPLPPNEEHY
jgi:hypothetical protein